MGESRPQAEALPRPSPLEAERIVQQSKAVFQRTLACWASDVLALQRSGHDRPCWRRSGDGFHDDHHWPQAA